ncbi:hypothetical protein [Nostoc foliaceum]|nr:hypothetical protein [Nostoc foliaceum]
MLHRLPSRVVLAKISHEFYQNLDNIDSDACDGNVALLSSLRHSYA